MTQPHPASARSSSEVGSTLRRRLTISIGMMIVGLLLLGSAAVVGIEGLHHDFGQALDGYQQLRSYYEIGVHVSAAQAALRDAHTDRGAAAAEVRAALARLNIARSELPADDPQVQKLYDELLAAQSLNPAPLDAAMSHLARLSGDVRVHIQQMQLAADARRRSTLLALSLMSALFVAGGIAIGVRQYRAVIQPLNRIGLAVRSMAGGAFGERIDPAGDREFAVLADDFNHMAAELQSLYRNLEEKVATKSKELVRSERLASVGFLAAGVAHEINNPLGIITGYGERAMQQIDRDTADPQRVRNAIAVMCEEAFRCKQITDRLLSLARPGGEERARVCLVDLAHDVIATVGGLPEYREKRLLLEAPRRDLSEVFVSPGEIKQVILNLVINALQAVEPGGGEVKLSISAEAGRVELRVSDNGRGMDQQTLDRVFEPFFTLNRAGRSGTGLGLSISHATIAAHAGTISASSAGEGSGSCFTVSLPGSEGQRDEGRGQKISEVESGDMNEP